LNENLFALNVARRTCTYWFLY